MNITQTQFERTLTSLLHFPGSEKGVTADSIANGLAIAGSRAITRVGFAVSSNLETFERAVKKGCNALVVHHGLKFDPLHLDHINAQRLAYLFAHNLNLYSAHFLLDAHPRLGNNAQLLEALGCRAVTPFAFTGEQPWGMVGSLATPRTVQQLLKKSKKFFSSRTLHYSSPTQHVLRIASVTGMGAPSAAQLDELKKLNVDLFVTGEVHEHHRDLFLESGIACIAGGHYHTETFGIRALQKACAHKGWDTVFIDYPNPV
ncbi:MAG: Nif3-like dinuclear metal center hexameric protein [Candidatus Kerfeldbacteria bacterium]|nr:Nif3-like dinuclear metal center hexameric protein [Candidatus Kerfeldbacteria bacterium]